MLFPWGKKRLLLMFCYFVLPLELVAGGYGLPGGYAKQEHGDELFIMVFSSSYKPVSCKYDHEHAEYFSKDGINNLFYFPSNKTTAIQKFLAGANELGMNGVIWVPRHWPAQGFGAEEYEQWIRSGRLSSNLFAWFMPDELPSILMKPNKQKNPIYDPDNPHLHDPDNPKIPWFFNEKNPDAMNTAVGRTRWFAKRIVNADPNRHIIIAPGNGGAMANPDRWTTLIENLAEYCDVWVRGVYPNWLNRPRTMLLYEYEQWVKSRDKARAKGANVNNLYFMLILESFKGPFSDPVNYVPYEIIRFDAYASLILGAQGLTWWHGQEWNNPDPQAQAMYDAIKSVAKEINIPHGIYLAPCLLADEPQQFVSAVVVDGPRKAPTYKGREYDSIQVRLKQEADDGSMYLFAANFAQVWNKQLYRKANEPGSYECEDPNVKARFEGFESSVTEVEIVLDSRNPELAGKTISVTNGSFEDKLQGLTARVYKVLFARANKTADLSVKMND